MTATSIQDEADTTLHVTLDTGGAKINCMSFTADGKLVATGHEDRTVRIWNAATGACVNILIGHTEAISQVEFNHNGNLLASLANGEPAVILWRPVTSSQIRTFSVGRGYSTRRLGSFSHDEKLIAYFDDRIITKFSIETGDHTGEHEIQEARSVALCPPQEPTIWKRIWKHAEVAMAVAIESKITLHDATMNPLCSFGEPFRKLFDARIKAAAQGTLVPTGDKSMSWWLGDIAFSDDGQLLADHGRGFIALYRIPSGELKHLWSSSSMHSGIARPRFTSDQKSLLVACSNGFETWDLSTDERTVARSTTSLLSGPGSRGARALAFDGAGGLAAATADKTALVFDIPRCVVRQELKMEDADNIALSPDGTKLGARATDGTVRVVEVSSHRELFRCKAGEDGGPITFSPDGSTIATCGPRDEVVFLIDVRTSHRTGLDLCRAGTSSDAGSPHDNQQLIFSPKGDTLWRADGSGAVMGDLNQKDVTRRVFGEGHRIFFQSNGDPIAVSLNGDETLTVWDTIQTRKIATFHPPDHPTTDFACVVAFDPKSKTLAAGREGGAVCFFKVESFGRLIREIHAHVGDVRQIALSQDGGLLATSSWDRICLWDMAHARLVATLATFDKGWISFSDDGRYKSGGIVDRGAWLRQGLTRYELADRPDLRVENESPLFVSS